MSEVFVIVYGLAIVCGLFWLWVWRRRRDEQVKTWDLEYEKAKAEFASMDKPQLPPVRYAYDGDTNPRRG